MTSPAPISTIAIIGTGNVGAALGKNYARRGMRVVFGARNPDEAADLVAACGPNASATTPDVAVREAPVVFLAVPGGVAVEVALGLPIDGKIVIDCTNPLKWNDGPVPAPPAEGSNAEAIAAALTRDRRSATIVKAFNTFGAEFHGDPVITRGNASWGVDVQFALDDLTAKPTLSALIAHGGYTPVFAGPLRNARLLEHLAVLWIHLAMREAMGRNSAFTFVAR